MKKSVLARFSRWGISLALVVLIAGAFSFDAVSWGRFQVQTGQWMSSFTGLFSGSDGIPIVSAGQISDDLSNWQSWPKSRKHKDFDGGWIMPFEMFQQRYYRGQPNINRDPRYDNLPVSVDMNGDGLQDLVYSKGRVAYNPNAGGSEWDGLDQFIILRRANGFQLTYKCRQEREIVLVPPFNTQETQYWYYGDCADTSYVDDTEPAYQVLWRPTTFWHQQTPNWTNSNPIRDDYGQGGNGTRDDFYGFDQDVFDYVNIDINVNSQDVATFDRKVPKMIDLNGDGLLDILFMGQQEAGQTYNLGFHTFVDTNFLLYNNGHGFDLEAACISRPNWILGNPLYSIVPGGDSQAMTCY